MVEERALLFQVLNSITYVKELRRQAGDRDRSPLRGAPVQAHARWCPDGPSQCDVIGGVSGSWGMGASALVETPYTCVTI